MASKILGVVLSLLAVLGAYVLTTCRVGTSVERVFLQSSARRLDGVEGAHANGATDLEAVYDFWDDVNKQHTFHFAPAWRHGGRVEMQGGIQFYASRTQQPGTSPVYDWWDDANKQHTFHMAPAWRHGNVVERKGQVQFYAYEDARPGTQPVYAFWDNVNKQHTFHTGSAWIHGGVAEQRGSFVFYANVNARGESAGRVTEPQLKPVFDFWDDGNKQHTFHMLPAWGEGGSLEHQGDVQFLAYHGPFSGTEPVYDFWDTVNRQHTFHFAPAWPNEIMKEVQFYSFRENSVLGLVAIHDFWDGVNKQHTFHTSPTWPNEQQRAVQFYAFGARDEAPITTFAPTLMPTFVPTFAPTPVPTLVPTPLPTNEPTPVPPTSAPTVTPSNPDEASCHTCVEGDLCFRDVRWAINHGVRVHPEWYIEDDINLGNETSCFEQVQLFLHRRQQEDESHWQGMVHVPQPQPVPLPCDADGPNYMRFGLLYCR